MRILIADDQRIVAQVIAQMVEICNHETVGTVTTGGLDVIAAYDRLLPDVVIMDIHMPRLNDANPCAEILFFSGNYNSQHPFVRRSRASGFLEPV